MAARRSVTLAVTKGPRLRLPEEPEDTSALSPRQSRSGSSSRGPRPMASVEVAGMAQATSGSWTVGRTPGRLRLRASSWSGEGGWEREAVVGAGRGPRARSSQVCSRDLNLGF